MLESLIKKQSLFKRILIPVIVLVLITMAASSIGYGLISYRAFLRTIKADYSSASTLAGRHISFYIGNALQEIKASAAIISSVRMDQWRSHMALVEMRHKFPHFQYLALVDLEGREISNSRFNQNFSNREAWIAFQEAREGRLSYSRTIIQDRLPVMFIAAPVYSDGRVSSVVWAQLNLKPVWDLLIQLKRDLNFGAEGHVYLVDRNGILIGSDDISKNFGRLIKINPPDQSTSPLSEELKEWRLDKSLDTHDPETLKSLLQGRHSRPDFWIAETGDRKSINVRTIIQELHWNLYLVQPYSEAFQFLHQGFWASLGVMSAVIVLGVLLAYFTAKRILSPLDKLHRGVTRAAKGDFSQPIFITSRDEVGELADHFNNMQMALNDYFERLTTATSDLNHAKCLAVLGTTASKVNHQVGNFLNNLVLALSILKSDSLSESSRASLAVIEENTQQIQFFIERLLSFARKADLSLKLLSPAEEVERITDRQVDSAAAQGVKLIFNKGRAPDILADPVLFEQAVINLIQNAVEASSTGVDVNINITWDGIRVKIEVIDHGRGISPQEMENVFTPFFTTKTGKGTGLGLALVETVIQAHGGETVLTSEEGIGTTAAVLLPPAPPTFVDASSSPS